MNWQPIFDFIKSWKPSNKTLITIVVLVGIGFFAGFWTRNFFDPMFGTELGMGWVDDPQYVKDTIAAQKLPMFGDAGKDLVQDLQERDVFLWEFYTKVHNKEWKPHNQNGTGCCVGEGWSTALEILQPVDAVVNKKNIECKHISAAAMYALAREAGGMLRGRDGSRGVDAAKALKTLGSVSCDDAKDDNTTGRPHAELARRWGHSGLPDNLKALAKDHTSDQIALVRTPEEVLAALLNGYPVPICSNVGFANRRDPRQPMDRDDDGFVAPYGTWNHCMCVVGFRADKRWFCILQSWGEVPGGPRTKGQPVGSFWIDWKTMQRIVGQGESYAISSYDGFKKRDLNVFVANPTDSHLAAYTLLPSGKSPSQRSVLWFVQPLFASRF